MLHQSHLTINVHFELRLCSHYDMRAILGYDPLRLSNVSTFHSSLTDCARCDLGFSEGDWNHFSKCNSKRSPLHVSVRLLWKMIFAENMFLFIFQDDGTLVFFPSVLSNAVALTSLFSRQYSWTSINLADISFGSFQRAYARHSMSAIPFFSFLPSLSRCPPGIRRQEYLVAFKAACTQ